MRILMIAPTPYFSDRGCHVRIYEEAKALIEKGNQVHIVTYHLGRDMPGVPVTRTLPIPWYGKLNAGPSWHKPYLDILLIFKALAVSRSYKPDVIHAHLHEGALVGWLLKLVLRIPLLFDYQGSMSGESISHGFIKSGSLLHSGFRSVEKVIDRCADAIVTSSSEGRRELVETWGIAPEMVVSLIDGVDTDVFRPVSRQRVRQELGIADDMFTVAYLGLFNRYQGVDLLLDAIVLLKERGEAITFLLMGFPETEYRQRAAELGIGEMITFTGRVAYDKAAEMLCAGDVAISPKLSQTEANGKLFNYMACGLPTIVFDNKINREILGDDGVYAAPGSASSLAECILALKHDGNLRMDLGARLRHRAENLHSWGARAENLMELYGRMRSKPGGIGHD